MRTAHVLCSHAHLSNQAPAVLRETVVRDEFVITDRLGDEIEGVKRVECLPHFLRPVLLEEDAAHFFLAGFFGENLECVSCVEDTRLDPLQSGKVDFRHYSSFLYGMPLGLYHRICGWFNCSWCVISDLVHRFV